MTDGQLPGDDRLITRQPADGLDSPIIKPATELGLHSSHFGGAGVGWLQPTDAQRIVLVALPGGVGGGVAVPVDPTAGRAQSDVLVRRSEATDGPRAVAVVAAILALLLAASSSVWALYKFKPGLITKKPSQMDAPVYAVAASPSQTAISVSSPGLVSNGTLIGVIQSLGTTSSTGGLNTASQTALSATNWNNYINELASLFSTQLTTTGSGIAGLMAGSMAVTRATQTELIAAGLGRQLHGKYTLYTVQLLITCSHLKNPLI